MSGSDDWSIPQVVQPRPEAQGYDLDRALSGVLQLHSRIPEDAFSAATLGSERHGSAVLLEGGRLAVTIGYLVTEAEEVWLTSARGAVVPAHVLGIDFASGLALMMLMGRFDLPGLPLGSATAIKPGDALVVAACGGRTAAVQARLLAKREFAGYWEYVLDEALFTGPAHPHWGGTACIGADGRLAGIGSLLLKADLGNERATGANMVVPIDLLPPIMDDLQKHGRVQRPARPWLGIYAIEAGERLAVNGLAPDGPAQKAGVDEGDLILAVGAQEPGDLAELWRMVWALGDAGVAVPLTLQRNNRRMTVTVVSGDRESFLRRPRLH